MNIKTRLLKLLFDEVYEFNRTAQEGLRETPVYTSAYMEKKKTEFEKSLKANWNSNTFAQDRYADDILRLLKDIDKAIAEQKLNEELARNED